MCPHCNSYKDAFTFSLVEKKVENPFVTDEVIESYDVSINCPSCHKKILRKAIAVFTNKREMEFMWKKTLDTPTIFAQYELTETSHDGYCSGADEKATTRDVVYDVPLCHNLKFVPDPDIYALPPQRTCCRRDGIIRKFIRYSLEGYVTDCL